jgi:hypothetical protein
MHVFRSSLLVTVLSFCLAFPAMAQLLADLQLAELTEKLQLSAHQQKELTPVIERRDNELQALKADSSMGKLEKLEKLKGIHANFNKHAAKILSAGQFKKLEQLQAERREKLERELLSGH